VQVVILPIAERHLDYAREIKDFLLGEEIRVEVNDENATLGAKIRKAEMEKVPYLAIVGDREVGNRTLSVRKRKKGDIGSFSLDDLLRNLKREIEEKVID